MEEAASRGITVFLYPCYCGAAGTSEGWLAEIAAASDAQMYAWGQYIGSRYKDYDNLVWMIGADIDPDDITNLRSRLNQVALGIKSVDGACRMFSAENEPNLSAMDEWTGSGWLTLNSLYTSSGTVPTLVAAEYTRSGALPLFNIEDYYEGEHSMTALKLREEAYWEVLHGCTLGRFFGNYPLWGFTYNSADWADSLGSSGSVSQSWLGKLMRSREFWLMVPDLDHSVVTDGYGSGNN